MKVQAFTVSRPSTNLVPDAKYQLTKDQKKSGFMGVFTWAYTGDPGKTLTKIALGAVMDTASYSMAKEPRAKTQEERAAKRMRLVALRAYEDQRKNEHLAQFTSLKKVGGDDPHFILRLPILKIPAGGLGPIYSLITNGAEVPVEAVESFAEVQASGERVFPVNQCLVNSRLPAATQDLFKQCLTGVVYKTGNAQTVVYLEFKINQLEAEALVSTDWLEIRPVDLYPMFTMWVEAEYVSKHYGKTAISLSKISRTLPPHEVEDRRVDQHGLGITLDGQPIYIPAECDFTEHYESRFASVGEMDDDGEFKLMDIQKRPTPPRLPANIPVLTDWVNFKFTYTNSAGRPVILPLENVRKCSASMALNILNREIDSKFLLRLNSYADIVRVSSTLKLEGVAKDVEEEKIINTLFKGRDIIDLRTYAQGLSTLDRTTRYYDLVAGDEFYLAPVRAFIQALYPAMEQNVEALYSKFAVSTVIGETALGMVGLMYHYGLNLAETTAESNKTRKAALTQGLDPNWTPPDMPLITESFSKEDGGLLPHQAKVRNLLRESPDFAVLSVDAGGGKSMLSITDVLYEIKAKRSAPYLIMCPGHLVANYVSELVEFTDGRLNVIPITSYNIRTTGAARIQSIVEAAPINTVLVVDYGALKYRAKSAVYGTTSVAVFPVVELIRKFRPGYAMLDESHMLKNAQSATFKAVMNLITDIPKKRIASGTLNPDSPSDLPAQMAIMDPTIFGTREDFNNRYGAEVAGKRVIRWRTTGPNSVGTVMATLKQNVVWCSAKRKEWACALPPRQDRFIAVQLSEEQRRVYNAIFDDMVSQIRKAAEKDANARALLDKLEGKKASKDDEDSFGDMGDADVDADEDLLDDTDDVGPGLQPYLADIERYVTNPGFHPYARDGFVTAQGEHIAPLTGDDLKPPKAVVLEKLMREDYDVLNPNVGKTLIFVNYNESAESIYNAMPPDIKACGLLYSAANKTELVNQFKRDKKIRWMIGIRRSLEVGLNLQIASNLVRLEGVWTPGEQEQGDSRIARPYFGPGGDQRPKLCFDTIVADRTLDITKAARLRAKIVALAKFENTGNPNYEALDDIPIIPMRLESIQAMNDFQTNLAQYETVLRELNQITKDEYAEYRKKIEAEGGFKFTQVKQAPIPEGCALLARVPYAQGTELYKASELGLVRLDNYLGMELSGEDDEEDTGIDEDGENDVTSADVRNLVVGLPCHTEYGEGIVKGIVAPGGVVRRVHVTLNDGTEARSLRSTNVFIITRTETNSIDMRNKIAQAAGLEVTGDITVPGANIRQTKMTLKQQRALEKQKDAEIKERQRQQKLDQKAKRVSVALQLNLINGYLQVGYAGNDEKVLRALEGIGFKKNPQYYYTRIYTYKQLLTQAQNWADAGFHIGDKYDSGALAALSVALTQNGLQSHRHYSNLLGEAQFKNYMRETFRPTSDSNMLNMFALVTDGGWADSSNIRRAEKKAAETGEPTKPAYGIAYLCLPAGAGQPGTKRAIQPKYSAPRTRWFLSDDMLTKFVKSLQGVHDVIEELHAAGIKISNVDELNKYARSVKKVAPKTDDLADILDGDDEDEAPKKRRVPTTTKEKAVKPKVTIRKKART